MNESDARTVVAAMAIEFADAERLLVPTPDRRAAATAAGAPLPPSLPAEQRRRFLSTRAKEWTRRVSARHPEQTAWLPEAGASLPARRASGSRRFLWVAVVALLAAAAGGYLSSQLGPDRRINILAYPLLGIVAWSLLVCAGELLSLLRRSLSKSGPAPEDRPGQALAALFETRLPSLPDTATATALAAGPKAEESAAASRVLAAAARRYEALWQSLSAPLWRARTKTLLHAAAFLLAFSAVGGLYVKGLANEYRAVWESTFFADGEALRPVLATVLGPAAAATGREIPDAAALDAMRWSAETPEVPGESAAWWIHWYAITVALFVLLPRALLAALWSSRAARLSRRFEVEALDPAYFAALCAGAADSGRTTLALPYAIRPDAAFRDAVEERLASRLGQALRLRWAEPMAFGEEDAAPEIPGDGSHEGSAEGPAAALPAEAVAVFSFSDTPEAEAHGEALETLGKAAPCPLGALVLDTRAFLATRQGQPDLHERFDERLAAWRRLAPPEIELVPVPPPPAT